MKIQFPKYFNMIEMALAIAILAIGAICIISILPVGVKENKTSSGENYSAHAAESFKAYISRAASGAGDTWSTSGLFSDIPSAKPTVHLSSSPSSWDNNNQWLEGDIFKPTGAATGVYAIRMQTALSSDTSYDFSGELNIWQTPVSNMYLGGSKVALSTDDAIGINMEISWPEELPYQSREKRQYYFELFNFFSNKTVAERYPASSGSSTPITFALNNGTVTLNSASQISMKVIAISIYDYDWRGNATAVPVYVKELVKNSSGVTTTYYPSGSSSTKITAGTTFNINANAGDTFTISAYARSTVGWISSVPGQNPNIYNCLAMSNGMTPPSLGGFSNQSSLASYLAPYVNNGVISLASNQVIYCYELGNTNSTASGFDIQDFVVLATFTKSSN